MKILQGGNGHKPWHELYPKLADYIIECYAGVGKDKNGKSDRREFIWEDKDGNVLIGNVRAFVNHIADMFDIKMSYGTIAVLLRELDGKVHKHEKGERVRGTRKWHYEPDSRIIRHKEINK